MTKRYTPAEIRARSLVKRLIVLESKMQEKAPGDDIQQQMADAMRVDRTTMNRWLNWTSIPRGPSLSVIEVFIEKQEA